MKMFATLSHSSRTAPEGTVNPARKGFFARIQRLVEIRGQRQALLRLDAALLKDIGLTREEALAEAARPAWDAPRFWRV